MTVGAVTGTVMQAMAELKSSHEDEDVSDVMQVALTRPGPTKEAIICLKKYLKRQPADVQAIVSTETMDLWLDLNPDYRRVIATYEEQIPSAEIHSAYDAWAKDF